MAIVSAPQFKKIDALIILVILCIGIVLRVMYFNDYRSTEVYPIFVHSDSYSYYMWAKDIAYGDVWGNKAFMKWPLYAYFLGLLFKLFGDNLLVVFALQFILGALHCVLLYIIARVLFDRRVAILSAFLCLWYGLFIFYDGLLIYTSLSLFLNAILFLYFLHIQNNVNKINLFLAGAFLGVCALTQANIIIFGLVAILWILWQKRQNIRQVMFNFFCFAAGLSILIGAVALRNYLVERDFVLIAGNMGMNFYLGNNSDANAIFSNPYFTSNQDAMFRESKAIARMSLGKDLSTSEASRFWFNKSLDFIKQTPLGYIKLLFKKLFFLFNFREFVHDHEYRFISSKIKVFKVLFMNLWLILPLALAGMLLNIRKFKQRALLYFAIVTFSLSIILFFVATRYRIVMVPFLIIFASSAVFSLWDSIVQKRYVQAGKLSLLFLAAFLICNATNYNKTRPIVGYKHVDSEMLNYHLWNAVISENKTEYEKAIKELQMADSIMPDNQYVLFSLGSVYYHMNNFKMAEEKFKQIIASFPFYIDAYYNLGLIYNEQQRFTEAAAVLEKAVFLDPLDAGIHFELARTYKLKHDLTKARHEFEAALRNINLWRTKDRALIQKELKELGQ